MITLNNEHKLAPAIIKKTASNPRHFRLITELASRDGLTSKQVGTITGASNPYSEIECLRKLGWLIWNSKHFGVDRDGRRCKFEKYHLCSTQLVHAAEVTNLFAAAT